MEVEDYSASDSDFANTSDGTYKHSTVREYILDINIELYEPTRSNSRFYYLILTQECADCLDDSTGYVPNKLCG